MAPPLVFSLDASVSSGRPRGGRPAGSATARATKQQSARPPSRRRRRASARGGGSEGRAGTAPQSAPPCSREPEKPLRRRAAGQCDFHPRGRRTQPPGFERLAPDSGSNLRGRWRRPRRLYSTTILGDTTLGGLGPLDVDNHTGPVSTVVVALAGGEHGHSMVLKATTHGIAARECARLRRLEPINVAPRAFGSRYGHGWSACAMERLGDEYDTLAQLREAGHYFDRDSTAAALARAIAAVNDAGIRHRDVNPANGSRCPTRS